MAAFSGQDATGVTGHWPRRVGVGSFMTTPPPLPTLPEESNFLPGDDCWIAFDTAVIEGRVLSVADEVAVLALPFPAAALCRADVRELEGSGEDAVRGVVVRVALDTLHSHLEAPTPNLTWYGFPEGRRLQAARCWKALPSDLHTPEVSAESGSERRRSGCGVALPSSSAGQRSGGAAARIADPVLRGLADKQALWESFTSSDGGEDSECDVPPRRKSRSGASSRSAADGRNPGARPKKGASKSEEVVATVDPQAQTQLEILRTLQKLQRRNGSSSSSESEEEEKAAPTSGRATNSKGIQELGQVGAGLQVPRHGLPRRFKRKAILEVHRPLAKVIDDFRGDERTLEVPSLTVQRH